jgi:hypothetical protein
MFLFRRYSLSPDLKILRVIVTSVYSVGRTFLSLTNVSEISAIPIGFFKRVPLNITFSILSLRNVLDFCSPNTHLIPSTIFVLPHPFGPTIPVMPLVKFIKVLLAKDLNPNISNLDRYNG